MDYLFFSKDLIGFEYKLSYCVLMKNFSLFIFVVLFWLNMEDIFLGDDGVLVSEEVRMSDMMIVLMECFKVYELVIFYLVNLVFLKEDGLYMLLV